MITILKKIASRLINRVLSVLSLQVRRVGSGFWDTDSRFIKLNDSIRERTVVKIDRAYALYQFAGHAATLPRGDFAQLGVYRGGTAWLIASRMQDTGKKFYLFDTFEGLPPSSEKDGTNQIHGNDFSDVQFVDVQKYFSEYKNIEFRKGMFPETAIGLEQRLFSFVYLDADLYQSTKDGLNFFYPRMVPGGVIMLDDYKSSLWPGIEKAVEEFCHEQNISPIITTWWQGLIIKGA